jgi:polyisoprenoid-binding protein YceI
VPPNFSVHSFAKANKSTWFFSLASSVAHRHAAWRVAWCVIGLALCASASSGTSAHPAKVAGKSVLRQIVTFGSASKVEFFVTIFGIFKKRGEFTELSGSLRIVGDSATVAARIAANSARMRSASDAALLMSQPYFDAKNHPHIEFKSQRFPATVLRSGGRISGAITLRGVTQAQGFLLQPLQCAAAKAINRCQFRVTGVLQRSEFGMRAKRGVVSDQVALVFTIAPQ